MGTKGKLSGAATEICKEIVQHLAPIGEVSSKKMFGGYGIFESKAMFAIIDSQGDLFFKVGEANRAHYEEIGAEKHGRMPYFAVPPEVLEDADELRGWAKASIEIAHSSKKK